MIDMFKKTKGLKEKISELISKFCGEKYIPTKGDIDLLKQAMKSNSVLSVDDIKQLRGSVCDTVHRLYKIYDDRVYKTGGGLSGQNRQDGPFGIVPVRFANAAKRQSEKLRETLRLYDIYMKCMDEALEPDEEVNVYMI